MKLIGARVFLVMSAVASGGVLGCDGRTPIGEPIGPRGPGDPSTSTNTTTTTTTTTTPAAPVDTQEVQQSLMARWNAVAATPVSGFDFRWNTFNQFPHPTYKGGTAEAYQAFATVLLAFFDGGDDFDFLARNHLFKLHLVYIFPSGGSGLDTNFQALAMYLTNRDGFPNVPADTRDALAVYVDRIEAVESGVAIDRHPDAGTPPKPDVSYETMCRNYCNALQESNIYGCASQGRDCRDLVLSWGDLCYRDRCVPMLVSQSLCFQQCDGLAPVYDAVCTGGKAAAPLCPTPPADHDRACHDGCALPPGS